MVENLEDLWKVSKLQKERKARQELQERREKVWNPELTGLGSKKAWLCSRTCTKNTIFVMPLAQSSRSS